MEEVNNGGRAAWDAVRSVAGQAKMPVAITVYMKVFGQKKLDQWHRIHFEGRSMKYVKSGDENTVETKRLMNLFAKGKSVAEKATVASWTPFIGRTIPLGALQQTALVVMIARQAIEVADLVKGSTRKTKEAVGAEPPQLGWLASVVARVGTDEFGKDVQDVIDGRTRLVNPLASTVQQMGNTRTLALHIYDLEKFLLRPGEEEFTTALCCMFVNLDFIVQRGPGVLNRTLSVAKEKLSGFWYNFVGPDAKLASKNGESDGLKGITLTESTMGKTLVAANEVEHGSN